ncbi:MAG: PLDc N-terminal domain-containing protein [archaeon]
MVGTGTTILGVFAGIVLLILAFWLFFVVLGILAFIFWIFMIVDVVQRKFKNESDKIVWALVVILLHIVGALIYYFVVKRENKH